MSETIVEDNLFNVSLEARGKRQMYGGGPSRITTFQINDIYILMINGRFGAAF